MNTLSWLIYVAETVGSLRGFLIGSAVWSGGVIGVTVMFTVMMASMEDHEGDLITRRAKLAWVPVLLGLLAGVIPSERTIYMIAASEVGETIVTSPDAIEMVGDLKTIIKNRLSEEGAK